MERIDIGGGAQHAGLAKRHPKAILALAILTLFTILSYADRMVIVLLVDPIRLDLGIDDVQVSLLTGVAFALCFGLASLPLAWVADRYSRRWVIYGGVTVWSLATAAGGIANGFGELFMARFFVGVGEAALAPAAFAMIPDLFPKKQVARATGILASAAALGGGMAILGGGFLVSATEAVGTAVLPLAGETRPWQMVFLILGLPGLALALLTFLLPGRTSPRTLPHTGTENFNAPALAESGPDIAPSATDALPASYLSWLKQNWLFVGGLSIGCSALAALAYGLTSWTPTYLSRVFGLSMAEVGVTLGLVQMLCGLVGYIGGGTLIDWMEARGIRNAPHRYLMFASIVAMVAAVGGFYFAGSIAVAMVFIGIYHLAAPFNSPMVVAMQKGAPAAFRGQAIALTTMIATLIGLLAGPTAMALFTEDVFGDPVKVGWSVASVGLVCGVVAFVSLAISYGPALRAREALDEAGEG
ncbi:MFS transporter [Novosphingobium pentaromativorans]|uniref:Major facilitator superfamily (MFS) profile domain-containing protein n=1 Tax=Novosphingobium pentaromativorans US6-1 TaxID=1088721 RepID=G6ECL0_9SPHN|nr:MFS transporter [Novosphingobium pentaromativorans]AIT80026.1 hypothetical protein JI59_09675 [Novosphingobium pentaromativorans US6-1]EHJ60921.1 hypothetical protein NSU_2081 [Novosphingobium pentaromativorans US6-1]